MANTAPFFHGLDGLIMSDKLLFNQYGRGATTPVPFRLVHEAFEHHADSQPEEIAVRYDGKSITYGELERRANILANKLISSGLYPRQRVCIVVRRSIHMVIAILAVLKAGCQYVPLDGGVIADDAMRHIFLDTAAPFVLCLSIYKDKVQKFKTPKMQVITLDRQCEDANKGLERPHSCINERDGAYIIYTSGTTGKPKGVDVMHLGATNTLCLAPSNMGIRRGSKVAQLLSISFDMGAWEILGTMMNGGTLYIRGSDWHQTLSKVDTLIATPSILAKFKKHDYPNIQHIAVGGEPCPKALADEWSEGTNFYNVCGPTEISILNTAHLHQPGRELSIGRPNPNTNIYILDEEERPVPIGQDGVMWVGGMGVSRGYLNLPELTAARFKRDKFTNDGNRMFNTGDLGKWRPDGSLDHLGRVDDQVKIKGFRVELDGVSSIIESFPSITKACALVIDDILYGFYSAPYMVDEEALRKAVSSVLPYYAVPSKWVFMSSIALTTNGKINKQSLREEVRAQQQNSPAFAEPVHSQQTDTGDQKAGTEKEEAAMAISGLHEFGSTETLDGSRNASTISDATTCGASDRSEMPATKGAGVIRRLRYRIFNVYRRLFSLVFILNAAGMALLLTRSPRFHIKLPDLGVATSSNILVAVLIRQEHIINLLFWFASSVPRWFPMCIRRQCARIYHLGGMHSGCGVAATAWFVLFTIAATLEFFSNTPQFNVDLSVIVITYITDALLVLILVMAHPVIRSKWHNSFELTHRFAGWTTLSLVWIHTILTTNSIRGVIPLGDALCTNPCTWMLAVTSLSILAPWLSLRKVSVRPEYLSNHAIRLRFDYCTPRTGTGIRLSNHPLREWHAFAAIPEPGKQGFSVVVSHAGDWTRKTIDTAPTTIWKRGIPTAGVLTIAPIFESIVLVATGSGIGPCLPLIMEGRVPVRIIWSTPNPIETFGKDIVQTVMNADPNAVIHNTRTHGKPNLTEMAYVMYKEAGAEAVCVISNKKVTQKVVYEIESRGIPAFGPIWDS